MTKSVVFFFSVCFLFIVFSENKLITYITESCGCWEQHEFRNVYNFDEFIGMSGHTS